MADISLQEYLEKVETLLQGDNNDEVVQHCRHILRYYPKNAAAYRLLGQALLHGSSLDEAEEILRRVLSVYPDDYVAHLGLSEIQERRSNGNEAIWHLERAFEQTPNDAQITDKLRDLYRRYRQTNQDRIQLTSGALARQYIRSGLHTQAIGTLQNALAQSPKRAPRLAASVRPRISTNSSVPRCFSTACRTTASTTTAATVRRGLPRPQAGASR